MQDFAQLIAEAFHSEANVNWKLKSSMHVMATFLVRSVTVEVSFEQREDKGPWHVAFNTVGGEAADRTNMGLAFRIFNGVFQALREFIETREPERVVFISKDQDLAGIYETYLRREKASLDQLGYTLQGPHRVDPYTEFTLRRRVAFTAETPRPERLRREFPS